jgi:hypothetical protein
MLAEARFVIESQPESWEVKVGTQILPKRKDLFNVVERTRFLELISRWEKVAARARESGRPVVFFGD